MMGLSVPPPTLVRMQAAAPPAAAVNQRRGSEHTAQPSKPHTATQPIDRRKDPGGGKAAVLLPPAG